MRYSVPRKSRRVPLLTGVHLKLEELPDPVTVRITNLSLGGMSVAIGRPSPVGSLVAFEFEIGDALVEGTGEVVWSREAAGEGSDRSAGMGIRFRYLSPGSRERIFRLVQWYANQEGEVTPEDVAAAAAAGLPSPGGRRGPALGGEEPPPPPEPSEAAAPAPGAGVEAGTLPGLEETAPPRPAEPAPAEPEAASWSGEPAAASWSGEPAASWTPWPEPPPPDAEPEPPFAETPEEPAVPAAELSYRPVSAPPSTRLGGSAYSRSQRRFDRLRIAGALALLLALIAAAYLLIRGPGLEWWRSWVEARSEAARETLETPPSEDAADREVLPLPPVEVVEPPEAGEEPPEVGEAAPEPAAAVPPAPAPPAGAEPPPRSAAVEEPAPVEAAGPPLRNVERIEWRRSEDATVVVIEGDGALGSRDYARVRLEGPNPRVLLRIRGVERPYSPPNLRAGSPELEAIRTGLHLGPGGSELHVVLDLASADVDVASVAETGRGIEVLLRRR